MPTPVTSLSRGAHLPRHIAFVDPASHTPELDTFNHLATMTELACCYHLPALFGMNSIQLAGERVRGIVLGGSGAHVSENKPWQAPLCRWIQQHIDKRTPILGICYGHQLIAHLAGTATTRLTEKRKGWRPVRFMEDARLGIGEGEEKQLLVSHQEYVDEVPTDFEVFAKSPEFVVDGLRHKSLPIWSVQAHPEATVGFCWNQDISPDDGPFEPGHQLLRQFISFCDS